MTQRADRAEAGKSELEAKHNDTCIELQDQRNKLVEQAQEMDFQVNQAMNQYQMSSERTATLQAENKKLVEETMDLEKRLALADSQIKTMTTSLSTERRQRQEASFHFDAERTQLLGGGDPNASMATTTAAATAAADAQEVQIGP